MSKIVHPLKVVKLARSIAPETTHPSSVLCNNKGAALILPPFKISKKVLAPINILLLMLNVLSANFMGFGIFKPFLGNEVNGKFCVIEFYTKQFNVVLKFTKARLYIYMNYLVDIIMRKINSCDSVINPLYFQT